MSKHPFPLGTRLCFQDDPQVYEVVDHQKVLLCPTNCEEDHECFTEPHLVVRPCVSEFRPISKISTVFYRGEEVEFKVREEEDLGKGS